MELIIDGQAFNGNVKRRETKSIDGVTYTKLWEGLTKKSASYGASVQRKRGHRARYLPQGYDKRGNYTYAIWVAVRESTKATKAPLRHLFWPGDPRRAVTSTGLILTACGRKVLSKNVTPFRAKATCKKCLAVEYAGR